MKRKLIQFLHNLRASYWFVPSVMLVAGIGLGAIIVWLDAGPARNLFADISWYQKAKPEGAREVLSIIAGSMITVAGVVFSITIVAISFAAGQYGPRVLGSFMYDRGNQITLGTFVSTFAYAVVVLRTIHGGDSSFVPQLAVLAGLILALCSIAVLIYFIHHVPESIQISTVTARIGRNLIAAIDSRVSEDRPGSDPQPESIALPSLDSFNDEGNAAYVTSDRSGYVQTVDSERLVSLASEHALIAAIKAHPGDFVFEGRTLLALQPAKDLSDVLADQFRAAWTIGSKRTPEEDPLLLVDELVEIAQRALSSGINDPHTANTCVDWLTAAVAHASSIRSGSQYLRDEHGQVRLITSGQDFPSLMQRSFAQLRPYLARDLTAATHALEALSKLGEVTKAMADRRTIRAEIDALTELARFSQQGPSANCLSEASQAALRRLRH